ncbi:protein ENHANCED DOWNY MILDEW 2 isoform X2 [Abrus precatorius]|uniref:Protein ENHANCED DOWNY MILDEW 2 isoform X2 n=1 Tax=Abrus precatorius TaxID=3816 RepID=A0A8B8KBF2_ABRPR|nr:protein ENHANCED DOWNY MILDEW 2 isoform X2 [Abrus precatorius]
MASSDDEGEAQLLSVSNYHFEDDKDAPVSFSVLPIQWSESEYPVGKKEQVFLHGSADNGLQKIFMQVVAWRFDLSYVRPEISVLSKDGKWIKLEKPRKSYEDTIRTILITIHFLNYVKKNPDATAKSAWDNLSKNKEFSSYEIMPSQKDLLNHMALMGEAAKRDAVLAKSKLLLMVLDDKDKLKINKLSDEEVKDLARPGFIIDDMDNDMIDETVEDLDEEDDLFDSVCTICDNGGNLLCCDGKCMRSFHASKEDGEDSSCASLGFKKKEVDEIQNFYCKNCEFNQHQCFACGTLGCSDKFSKAEVFKCASATCGLFYHPHCVAKLLHRVVEDAPKDLERNIAGGEPFTCPTHYCYVCKEMEDKKEHELQFAVCRRCPKSYHRKCLPRKISFEDIEDEGIITRAWEKLLPNNRILIYCLKHEIDDELGTPMRDHLKFPNAKATVREIKTEEKAKPAIEKRVISNKNIVDSENLFGKKTTVKVSKLSGKMSSGKVGDKKSANISGLNIPRRKTKEASRRSLNENKRSISKDTEISDGEENQASLGEQLFAFWQKGSEKINSGNTLSVKPTKKLSSASTPLDADSERRLLALFKEATSSITLEKVIKDHKFASTHTHSLKSIVEKTITVGKLEGSVEAVRTALRMLDDGHNIRDAEAVCGPDVLNQIYKWKDKLKVYLAPVLYGNRYTSYGRHFTQFEKLEGIVDKLHWYVQNGDTIVDFCCGANDFSILMKKKLEQTGKRCSYKNYDLLPTKNDFNFEMRDWMTVQQKELPTGSQLIMGLNPPFGVKAILANKFIDKALEFRPKLLILIVPPETERLDEKRSAYDLVWEDEKFLSGKSFYLPGSVDSNDRQMEQWNVRPPPLYLWSRPDWTDKHKAIAREHGHLISCHGVSKMDSFDKEKSPVRHTKDDNYDDDMLSHDILKSTDDENQAPMNERQMGCLTHRNVDRESQERWESRASKADKTSWKRKGVVENDGRGLGVTSPPKRQSVNQMLEGVPYHSQSNPIEGRSSVEGFKLKFDMTPPYTEIGDKDYRHLEPTSSHMEFGAAYSGSQNWPGVASPHFSSGVTDIEEHHSNLQGNSTNNLGYRLHVREDEKYMRESEIRQHIRHYGLQNPDSMRSNYLSGHDPTYRHNGSSYAVGGSSYQSSYLMDTPAMQRYAPRLDELNHVRMDPLGSEPPIPGTNDTFERSVPQPGYGSWMPGFAAGFHNVYSRQSSADRFNQ